MKSRRKSNENKPIDPDDETGGGASIVETMRIPENKKQTQQRETQERTKKRSWRRTKKKEPKRKAR